MITEAIEDCSITPVTRLAEQWLRKRREYIDARDLGEELSADALYRELGEIQTALWAAEPVGVCDLRHKAQVAFIEWGAEWATSGTSSDEEDFLRAIVRDLTS